MTTIQEIMKLMQETGAMRALVHDVAKTTVTLKCPGCRKETEINRLNALNHRDRCYSCEPSVEGYEIGPLP